MNQNVDPKALEIFKDELDMIEDATLQGMFFNALAVAPSSFHDDEALLEKSKATFHILKGMLDSRNVQGTVKDALLGTVLLCDIMYNEFEDDKKYLHSVAVRKYLEDKQVHKDAHSGLWENVMRAIEAHEGSKCVSPLLEAKPGTAEYEVANAFAVAQLSYVHVDYEESKRIDNLLKFKEDTINE